MCSGVFGSSNPIIEFLYASGGAASVGLASETAAGLGAATDVCGSTGATMGSFFDALDAAPLPLPHLGFGFATGRGFLGGGRAALTFAAKVDDGFSRFSSDVGCWDRAGGAGIGFPLTPVRSFG
jgi:hypothetical protein